MAWEGLSLSGGVFGLDRRPVQVTHRSLLYESAPAYVTDQPRFLNAAVTARTELPPRQLLHELKAVEVHLFGLPCLAASQICKFHTSMTAIADPCLYWFIQCSRVELCCLCRD